MNTSRLLGAICPCLIACNIASTNASEYVVPIAKNSTHAAIVENIAPNDNQIKHGNTSSVENTVLVISVGLIGFFLLHKANNG
jgi:hypothetical protein